MENKGSGYKLMLCALLAKLFLSQYTGLTEAMRVDHGLIRGQYRNGMPVKGLYSVPFNERGMSTPSHHQKLRPPTSQRRRRPQPWNKWGNRMSPRRVRSRQPLRPVSVVKSRLSRPRRVRFNTSIENIPPRSVSVFAMEHSKLHRLEEMNTTGSDSIDRFLNNSGVLTSKNMNVVPLFMSSTGDASGSRRRPSETAGSRSNLFNGQAPSAFHTNEKRFRAPSYDALRMPVLGWSSLKSKTVKRQSNVDRQEKRDSNSEPNPIQGTIPLLNRDYSSNEDAFGSDNKRKSKTNDMSLSDIEGNVSIENALNGALSYNRELDIDPILPPVFHAQEQSNDYDYSGLEQGQKEPTSSNDAFPIELSHREYTLPDKRSKMEAKSGAHEKLYPQAKNPSQVFKSPYRYRIVEERSWTTKSTTTPSPRETVQEIRERIETDITLLSSRSEAKEDVLATKNEFVDPQKLHPDFLGSDPKIPPHHPSLQALNEPKHLEVGKEVMEKERHGSESMSVPFPALTFEEPTDNKGIRSQSSSFAESQDTMSDLLSDINDLIGDDNTESVGRKETHSPHPLSTFETQQHMNENVRSHGQQSDLYDILRDNHLARISRLLAESKSFGDFLASDQPFTIFAPRDEAIANFFERFPQVDIVKFIENHVVKGLVFGKTMEDNLVGTAIGGGRLRCNIYQTEDQRWRDVEVRTINGIRVKSNATAFSNGLIYTLDGVLYPPVKLNVIEMLETDPHKRFSTFLKALRNTHLLKDISDYETGPWTLFAPTNEAFTNLPMPELKSLTKDRKRLTRLLLNHMVNKALFSAGFRSHQVVQMASKNYLDIYARPGQLKVDGSDSVKIDVPALNGVIHVVRNVIELPEGDHKQEHKNGRSVSAAP